jgi:hypothetical protein
MTTPSQQQKFEAAIQQHIRQAVAAALAGMPPPAAPAPPTVNVNAVAVKLPEFWPADPTTWFHQAEGAFRRSNVTLSYTKYNLVNSMQPNTAHAYEQLKELLTTSYSKTPWQQVKTPLDMPPLGDRRPSHIMNEMLSLLPLGSSQNDYIFLGIFLGKLPPTMREHLAAANHTTADAMAAHADVLWDAKSGNTAINAISDASRSSASRSSTCRSPDHRSPDRRRGHSRQGRKPTLGPENRRRDNSALCFYQTGSDREPTNASRRVPGRKTRPPPWASQLPQRPSFPPR